MENEVLVKVEGVSKKFCKDFKRSLWFGAKDIATELVGLKRSKTLRRDEFWAVKDVSFELRRGECLGLIGHNGAGKSTLLKMLNGLIKPDEGTITMKGRIGALINLGSGFNPVLTGRENVFNNAVLYGFTHKEILTKYKDIVEFAEMEEFMETPVQNYSSGMKVRLGFAVAAQMEPDVLIIDEVLAVGDMNFKIKCLNVISNLLKTSSVIVVSHSTNHISRICTSLIFMKNGVSYDYGQDIDSGIQRYLESNLIERKKTTSIEANGVQITKNDIHKVDNKIEIAISLLSNRSSKDFMINFKIFDAEFKLIALIYSLQQEQIFTFTPSAETHISLSFDNPFPNGKYSINIVIIEMENTKEKSQFPLVEFENVLVLEIKDDRDLSSSKLNIMADWT